MIKIELLFNEAAGKAIQYLRESKNVSQEELAEKTGYARNSISRYETNSRQMTVGQFFSFAQILKHSPSEAFNELLRQIKKLAE